MNQQPDRTEAAYRAALGVMVEDTPPAPEWEDLLPTHPIPSQAATMPRRGWAVALVTAGIVLVLVGGIAIGVIAFGSNEDVIDQPPPTTAPISAPSTSLPSPTTTIPSPSTTLGQVAPVPLMDWQQVPSQAALGEDDDDYDYIMQAVITGGPGLIAAGQSRPVSDAQNDYELYPSEGTEATIWTSADGETWDRVPAEVSGLNGPGGYVIHDLTHGGPGYVAVGAALEEGQVHAAAWVSEDGLSWSRVESPSFQGPPMFAVTASDSGIVAVWGGAWYSPDGLEWQRADTEFAAWDVAHADWGFVAVGTKPGGMANSQWPYAWISQDGISWEGVNLHPTEEWIGAEVYSVIADGNEVVVAGGLAQREGSYFDIAPAFWTTNDGSEWSEHALPAGRIVGMDRPEALIEGLAVTDSGMVGVGNWLHRPKADWDDGWSRAAVWATSDGGTNWAEIPAYFPSGSWMWDVAVLDGVVFGVGDYLRDAAVWMGEWTD